MFNDNKPLTEQAIARLRERAEMAERERDEVTRQLNGERADHVRIAVAAGVFYENDYSGPTRGPVDAVVKEIEALVKDRAAADRLRSLDQAVRAYRRKERELLGLPDGALEEDHLQAIARLRTAQNERAIPPTEPNPAADLTGELFDVAMKERKERLALAKQLAEAQAERDSHRKLLEDTLSILPVGNLRTHTIDTVPDRVQAFADSLAEMREESVDAARAEHRASLERLHKCLDTAWERDAINAELAKLQPAPAPVTPPADAPARPSVETLRRELRNIDHDFVNGVADINAVDRLQRAVRLLLDDAIAARTAGGK